MPIAEPRGFPPDVCDLVKQAGADYRIVFFFDN